VTPREIVDSAIKAARAGAAIVHIHVRDPETGQPSMRADLYRETVQRIRDSGVDVIINLTTGPGARFVPGDNDPRIGGAGTTLKPWPERVAHVEELKPEACSLDVGSMNFGEHVFVNEKGSYRRSWVSNPYLFV
jgi:3-dehydrocarnitine:acetyl-CoA trimethylamine transferase